MAKGLLLKSLSWVLRAVEFCCAAIIVGIFGYFLAALATRDLYIATYLKAVEGISGAAVIYTAFALLLVCCLGGIAIFSWLGMLLDLAFCGAFIYLAYATRGGRNCSGTVFTPIGTGSSSSDVVTVVGNNQDGFVRLPSLHTACRLNTACFAVSIVGAVFFFLSIFVEYMLIQHRKKEKAFGPGPNNDYTAGTQRRKFWQRKPRRDVEMVGAKNPDALPYHTTPDATRASYAPDTRTSYATDATAIGTEAPVSKYGHGGHGYHAPPANGYVAPTGTALSSGLPHNPLVHDAGVTNNDLGAARAYNGYETTTTTHIPHKETYQAYSPHHTTNTTGTL